jgi:23S rRNA (adenine2030-N6)-methyltransferase
MKYRHVFHAGNFADVHKHVALIALLDALARKPKGFLFLDTHAGAGLYRLGTATARRTRAADSGITRLAAAAPAAPEIRDYLELVAALRAAQGDATLYPGSPLIAARRLRPQDRLVAIELDPLEAGALRATLGADPRVRIEQGDGYERLAAFLPPRERRGLVLIDPPYEEHARDFARVDTALIEALRRFATGVFVVWYPIKDARDTDRWIGGLAARLGRELLRAELWIHPPDSRVALNGSGLLVLNAPHRIAERMRAWTAELRSLIGTHGAGERVDTLNAAPAPV